MENLQGAQQIVAGKMDEVRHTFDNQEGRDKLKSRLMRTKTMVSQTSVEGEEEGQSDMKLEKCLTTFDLISSTFEPTSAVLTQNQPPFPV